MKKFLALILALCSFATLGLTACGGEEPSDHTHEFTNSTASAEYLKTEADCLNKALYFKSCSCGKKGEETFEYGDFGAHKTSTEWTKNDQQHWHACTANGCEFTTDVADHILTDGACACGWQQVATVVTSQQWEQAFAFENVTFITTSVMDEIVQVMTYKLNGETCLLEFDGDSFYYPTEQAEIRRKSLDFSKAFANATYTDGAYLIDSLDMRGDGSFVYSNIKIVFDQGKIVYIECDVEDKSMELSYKTTFVFSDYGQTSFVVPEPLQSK